MSQSIQRRQDLLTIKGQPTQKDLIRQWFLKRRMLRYASLRSQGVIPYYTPRYEPKR